MSKRVKDTMSAKQYRALLDRVNLHNRRMEAACKKIVYDHYGWRCNCCGETTSKFLTIDHINNDGYKDRCRNGKGHRFSGLYFYRKIIKEDFPKSLQILCYNCNYGKKVNNGVCPHITI